MHILVPTLNRVDRQITREKWFLDKLPYPWHYVCPERMKGQIDGPVMYVPDHLRIAGTRQWMLESVADPYHVILDDDLRVFIREDPEQYYLRKATFQDVLDLCRWMQQMLQEGYVHGGVSPRGGNNGFPPYYAKNTRVIRAHFYNAPTLIGEEIRFDDLVVMEDFHVTLRLLELGYTNVVSSQFAQDQDGSNVSGGCSEYRTSDVQTKGATDLARLHEHVRIVHKRTKTGGGMWTERTDVVCGWKKSFGTKADERKLNVAQDD